MAEWYQMLVTGSSFSVDAFSMCIPLFFATWSLTLPSTQPQWLKKITKQNVTGLPFTALKLWDIDILPENQKEKLTVQVIK